MNFTKVDEDAYYDKVDVLSGPLIEEAEFLRAYHVLFSKVQKESGLSIAESGAGVANVVMSKWVEPTACLSIVIFDEFASYKPLVDVAVSTLQHLGSPFLITIDDHPTHVCIHSVSEAFGTGTEEALRKFGFEF